MQRSWKNSRKGAPPLRYSSPPVFPIVFYDGNRNWTAARNFQERTTLSDLLKSYIPDFEYIVVPLSRYSDQKLIEKQDELSLIMLIDKLRNAADFHQLTEIPKNTLIISAIILRTLCLS